MASAGHEAISLFTKGRAPRSDHFGAPLNSSRYRLFSPRFMAHIKGKAARWRLAKVDRPEDNVFIRTAAACCLKERILTVRRTLPLQKRSIASSSSSAPKKAPLLLGQPSMRLTVVAAPDGAKRPESDLNAQGLIDVKMPKASTSVLGTDGLRLMQLYFLLAWLFIHTSFTRLVDQHAPTKTVKSDSHGVELPVNSCWLYDAPCSCSRYCSRVAVRLAKTNVSERWYEAVILTEFEQVGLWANPFHLIGH